MKRPWLIVAVAVILAPVVYVLLHGALMFAVGANWLSGPTAGRIESTVFAPSMWYIDHDLPGGNDVLARWLDFAADSGARLFR